jgi:hypothetical protein
MNKKTFTNTSSRNEMFTIRSSTHVNGQKKNENITRKLNIFILKVKIVESELN